MIKAIGSHLIIKVQKKKSAIDLSVVSNKEVSADSVATVESLGTKCTLGLEVGHTVMIKGGTRPTVIEETEEHDLLLIPESGVAYVTNWSGE